MADVFSIHEIVEIGVQIEQNGYDFYDEVIKHTKNNKAGEIFQFLKEEEASHIKTFDSILKTVHKYEPPQAYPEEYFIYMNALASEHVFTEKDQGREMGGKVDNDLEAVDLGIRFEKDSIGFYEGLRKITKDDDIKIIDVLIEEEKKHLIKLVNIRKEIMTGG